MNRGAIRTQAADFASDKNQTRFTSTQYNTAINRAQEQFALDTRTLWDEESYTTTIDDATYALPSDFMWEDWVTYDGKELVPISRHELQRLSGEDWTDDEGTPTHYIIDPEEGRKQILLYPIPQEAKSVVLRYFPLPAEMSADSTVPLNSSALLAQFHIGLAAYAAWLLLTGETQTPDIVLKRRELLSIYTDSANKATALFKNTASAPINIKGGAVWS